MKNLIALSPYLIIAAVVVFLFGAWTGYDYRSTVAEADQAKAVKFALNKQKEESEITRKVDISLMKSQKKTTIVSRSIIKEVPKHVSIKQKADGDCNPSSGVVRLLNSAVTERVPEATAIDDARDPEPSDITEERLINYSLGNIGLYNRAKNQCNALLQWHKEIDKNNDLKGN